MCVCDVRREVFITLNFYITGQLTKKVLYLKSPSDRDARYILQPNLELFDKRVVVKINFNAATIKNIPGWKKKLKSRTSLQRVSSHVTKKVRRTQNMTTSDSCAPVSTTSDSNSYTSEKISNEVETYFATNRIEFSSDDLRNSRTYTDYEESGESLLKLEYV